MPESRVALVVMRVNPDKRDGLESLRQALISQFENGTVSSEDAMAQYETGIFEASEFRMRGTPWHPLAEYDAIKTAHNAGT